MHALRPGIGIAAASVLLVAAALPVRGQEKDPPKPAPAEKPPPPDADLPPETEIQKESRSDPRNLKPDAFPVLRKPAYLGALEARKMDPAEWVIGTVIGKTALAFPINVLNHHEIVVDEAGGRPFLVTWCPLCRTGAVHSRTLEGETLDFGHSGLLYRSAFLLYDQKTRSLWHNATGRALTGKLRGARLEPIPCRFVTWGVWRAARPDTRVLAKDPLNIDHIADTYDRRNRALKLRWGLGITAGGEDRVYELDQLDRMPIVQETVGGVPLVVLFHPPTQTAVAFERTLGDRVLDLRRGEDGEDGLPRLEETGEDRSVFHPVTGECLSGPLKGKSLAPVLSSFWEIYAWTAHHPRGSIFRASVPPPQDLPDIPEDGR